MQMDDNQSMTKCDIDEVYSMHDVIEADSHVINETVAKYPDLFGEGRPFKLVYCIPFRRVTKDSAPFPRKLTDFELNTVHGNHAAPALQPSENDMRQLPRAKVKLEHGGKVVDGQFVGYKTINGDTYSLCVILQDTPERQRTAAEIGPGKKYSAVSPGTLWPVNYSKKEVVGNVSIDHIALTEDPYNPTYIYVASSKEAVELESAFPGLRMNMCGCCARFVVYPYPFDLL